MYDFRVSYWINLHCTIFIPQLKVFQFSQAINSIFKQMNFGHESRVKILKIC